MKTHKDTHWSIDLPEPWEAEVEEECTTVTHNDSLGALQISSATKDGPVIDADLMELAEDYLTRGTPDKVTFSKFVGLCLPYIEDHVAWRVWFVRSGDLLVFMTYNCDALDRGLEDEEIDSIVHSLRPCLH